MSARAVVTRPPSPHAPRFLVPRRAHDREQGRDVGHQRSVKGGDPIRHGFGDARGSGVLVDAEGALEQADDGQVRGGLPEGDRARLENPPLWRHVVVQELPARITAAVARIVPGAAICSIRAARWVASPIAE